MNTKGTKMTFDQKLAEEGKQRVIVSEVIQTPNGLATVNREKIVNIEEAKPAAEKKVRAKRMPAEPRIKRNPKPSSKQATVNALVKGVFEGRDISEKPSKEFKQEIISEIMKLCNMTQAGATTYFYNALKVL